MMDGVLDRPQTPNRPQGEDRPQSFGFLVLPKFAMMAFTAAV